MRSLLRKIEKWIDLPPLNLTYYLIGGQIIIFAITMLYPSYQLLFDLRGQRVLAGEWWRLVTFLVDPIVTDIIFAAFTWYIFYIYGMSLERWWGTTRFLMYLLISAVGTIVLSFVFPYSTFSNGYIFNSLFLAFAYLFPEFELRLFFIIPIKIKWLAAISWIVTGLSLLLAPIPQKISIVVSVLNFFIFFGTDIARLVRTRGFSTSLAVTSKVKRSEPKHICSVCGKSNVDDPYMGIRYCKICMPERCFCEEDFQKHSHPVN